MRLEKVPQPTGKSASVIVVMVMPVQVRRTMLMGMSVFMIMLMFEILYMVVVVFMFMIVTVIEPLFVRMCMNGIGLMQMFMKMLFDGIVIVFMLTRLVVFVNLSMHVYILCLAFNFVVLGSFVAGGFRFVFHGSNKLLN